MDATTVRFLFRRERGRERTREGERLPVWVFMPRRAGPGSGPSVLRGSQEYCRAATPEGREPQGDSGLPFLQSGLSLLT